MVENIFGLVCIFEKTDFKRRKKSILKGKGGDKRSIMEGAEGGCQREFP